MDKEYKIELKLPERIEAKIILPETITTTQPVIQPTIEKRELLKAPEIRAPDIRAPDIRAPEIRPFTAEPLDVRLKRLYEAYSPFIKVFAEGIKKLIEKAKEKKEIEEKEIEEIVGKQNKEDVKKILKELGIEVITTEEKETDRRKIAEALGIPAV